MAMIKVKNPKAPGEFLWLAEQEYRPGGRWELFVEDASAGTPAAPPVEATPAAAAPAAVPHSGNDLSAYDAPDEAKAPVRSHHKRRG